MCCFAKNCDKMVKFVFHTKRHTGRDLVGFLSFKQLCCSVLQNMVQDANDPVFFQAIKM